MPDAIPQSVPTCYVCGPANPSGLYIDFFPGEPDGSRAEYLARAEHTGWPGVVHGGLLFTLMDEAAAKALTYAGFTGVTAKAECRFREAVSVGARVVVTARIVERFRAMWRVRAEIRQADSPAGKPLAEMTATMYVTDVGKWRQDSPHRSTDPSALAADFDRARLEP